MTNRFSQIFEYLKNNFCTSILEIGVYKGDTALQMLQSSINPNVKYTGIDLFEDLTDQIIKKEKSLRADSVRQVKQKLSGYNVNLIKGFSKNILLSLNESFDFIFIDGGHSLETLRSDFYYSTLLIKKNGVIFIDDYTDETRHSDIKYFIDNELNEFDVEILPESDNYRGYDYKLVSVKLKTMKNKIDVLMAFDKDFLQMFYNCFKNTLPPKTDLYCYYYKGTIDKRFTGFNISKMKFTLDHLRQHNNLVFFCDCDVTFLRGDVLQELDRIYEENGKPDLLMQWNQDGSYEKCIGIMLMKPSERLCKLIERYLEKTTDWIIENYLYGQKYFNELLQTEFQDLKVIELPKEFYGGQMRGKYDVPENIMLYHATFENDTTDKYNILEYFKNIYR